MPPPNPARGEVVRVLDGAPRRLCLTLGALAELEGAFELESWGELAARLRRLSARDMALVLEALLRGGGESGVDVERIAFHEAAEAVAAAFVAAGR